jgi:hypothetical protein
MKTLFHIKTKGSKEKVKYRIVTILQTMDLVDGENQKEAQERQFVISPVEHRIQILERGYSEKFLFEDERL